eukprot:TRINITY_DN61748_c0_g1_i1.p1 TRINITY_DN61748_c0_g1~~TRINITY_DN61748_c0_g1_i1.p1  ORF type:complete len:564 (+),score=70.63 TRINITY_DN61748_c0_g1_i1:66-1757(+)
MCSGIQPDGFGPSRSKGVRPKSKPPSPQQSAPVRNHSQRPPRRDVADGRFHERSPSSSKPTRAEPCSSNHDKDSRSVGMSPEQSGPSGKNVLRPSPRQAQAPPGNSSSSKGSHSAPTSPASNDPPRLRMLKPSPGSSVAAQPPRSLRKPSPRTSSADSRLSERSPASAQNQPSQREVGSSYRSEASPQSEPSKTRTHQHSPSSDYQDAFGGKGLPRTPPKLPAVRSLSHGTRVGNGVLDRGPVQASSRTRSQPPSADWTGQLESKAAVFKGAGLPRTPPSEESKGHPEVFSRGGGIPRTPPRLSSQSQPVLPARETDRLKLPAIGPPRSKSTDERPCPEKPQHAPWPASSSSSNTGKIQALESFSLPADSRLESAPMESFSLPADSRLLPASIAEVEHRPCVETQDGTGNTARQPARKSPGQHGRRLPAGGAGDKRNHVTTASTTTADESPEAAGMPSNLSDVPGAMEFGWREYVDPGGRMVYVNDKTYEEAPSLAKVTEKMRKMREREAAGVHATGMRMDEIQEGQMTLLPCAYCGRKFNQNSIQRHEQVCKDKGNKHAMRL